MLATFGLERLESGLRDDTVSAADITDILAQAGGVNPGRSGSDRTGTTADGARQRRQMRELSDDGRSPEMPAGSLPTRIYIHHQSNPEFPPTRHADRV